MTVDIRVATGDLFADVASLLAPAKPTPHACWCLSYRVRPADFHELTDEQKPALLHTLCEREVAPGLIAYVDGEPAGWCGFGPRADVERFRASKTILPIDDLPVWSIICFVVTPRFRGRGLARELLNAAVDYARDQGAPAVEGYPVDPGEKRIGAGAAFVGTTALYESAGFTRMGETAAKTAGLPRWIMRRATS